MELCAVQDEMGDSAYEHLVKIHGLKRNASLNLQTLDLFSVIRKYDYVPFLIGTGTNYDVLIQFQVCLTASVNQDTNSFNFPRWQ